MRAKPCLFEFEKEWKMSVGLNHAIQPLSQNPTLG